MDTADQRRAWASVAQHIGRASGTEYETPFGPFATDDESVIALRYGSNVDSLKNTQAADSAVVIHGWEHAPVDSSEVIRDTCRYSARPTPSRVRSYPVSMGLSESNV